MKNIFLISAASLIIFFSSLPFLIKVNIVCRSQFGSCPVEVFKSTQSQNGKNLFSAKKNLKTLLSKDYLVSDYSFQFKLPNILLVNLLIKKPEFAVFYQNSKKYALIDKTGKVLSIMDQTSLPFISTTENLVEAGTNVSDNDIFALRLINGVFEMYQVNSAQIDNDTLLVVLPDSIKVIFPLEGDTDILLGSLRLVYSKITSSSMNGKYSQIDLRFKNPVLR